MRLYSIDVAEQRFLRLGGAGDCGLDALSHLVTASRQKEGPDRIERSHAGQVEFGPGRHGTVRKGGLDSRLDLLCPLRGPRAGQPRDKSTVSIGHLDLGFIHLTHEVRACRSVLVESEALGAVHVFLNMEEPACPDRGGTDARAQER